MYNSEIKFIIFNIMANNQFILFKIKLKVNILNLTLE